MGSGLGLIFCKVQGSRGNNPQTQRTVEVGRRVDFSVSRGLFSKLRKRRGILYYQPQDLDLAVRIRLPTQRTGTRSVPHNPILTPQI
jgi:hypothetical protein